jgi:hypothetical protein
MSRVQLVLGIPDAPVLAFATWDAPSMAKPSVRKHYFRARLYRRGHRRKSIAINMFRVFTHKSCRSLPLKTAKKRSKRTVISRGIAHLVPEPHLISSPRTWVLHISLLRCGWHRSQRRIEGKQVP